MYNLPPAQQAMQPYPLNDVPRPSRFKIMFFIVAIITLLAQVLIILSFATNNWIFINIDRAKISKQVLENTNAESLNATLYSNPIFYSRFRGLFTVCLVSASGGKIYVKNGGTVADDLKITDECYYMEWTKISIEEMRNHELSYPGYEARVHLIRFHVALFVIAIVLNFLLLCAGVYLIWNERPNFISACAIFSGAEAFTIALGMAVFHGYEYLESEKINKPGFFFNWKASATIPDMYINELSAYSYSYHYAYCFGWISMILAFIACTMYLFLKRKLMIPGQLPEENIYQQKSANQIYGNNLYGYVSSPPPYTVAPGQPALGNYTYAQKGVGSPYGQAAAFPYGQAAAYGYPVGMYGKPAAPQQYYAGGKLQRTY